VFFGGARWSGEPGLAAATGCNGTRAKPLQDRHKFASTAVRPGPNALTRRVFYATRHGRGRGPCTDDREIDVTCEQGAPRAHRTAQVAPPAQRSQVGVKRGLRRQRTERVSGPEPCTCREARVFDSDSRSGVYDSSGGRKHAEPRGVIALIVTACRRASAAEIG